MILKQSRKPYILFGLVVVLILVALGVYRFIVMPRAAEPRREHSQSTEPAEPSALTMESKLMFVGDTFWGRRLQTESEASPLGEMYPFSGLDTFDRPSYDAWIAHLECPSTTTEVSMADQEGPLIFNCRPGYLDEARKYFDIFSLANNHTDNVDGQAGLEETRTHLEEHKFQYFGHFDNSITEDICEVVGVPVRITHDDGSIKTGTFPLALCGYHYVFRLPAAGEIEQLGAFSDRFVTIAVPQMGQEYVATADTIKTQTYRSMIDQGADAVIGAHPHWVQNSEVYQNKLIMYSVGNFVFDQHWSADVEHGVGVVVHMNAKYGQELQAWLDLGEQCLAHKDRCLEQATQQNLAKPDIVLSYDLVAMDSSSGISQKGDAALQQAMETRANWASVKDQLLLTAPHD